VLLAGRVESIVEWLKPSILERPNTLTYGLVQNIYTVSAAMSTGYSGGLAVKAHTKPTEVAELVDRTLSTERIVGIGDRNGALDAPMSGRTARSEARSLQRKNLIRSELLLIKCLLLLLQRFDLFLDGDLKRSSAFDKKLWRSK